MKLILLPIVLVLAAVCSLASQGNRYRDSYWDDWRIQARQARDEVRRETLHRSAPKSGAPLTRLAEREARRAAYEERMASQRERREYLLEMRRQEMEVRREVREAFRYH